MKFVYQWKTAYYHLPYIPIKLDRSLMIIYIYRINIESINTNQYGKRSMKFIGAILWNSIPLNTKSSDSVHSFKRKVKFKVKTCLIILQMNNIILFAFSWSLFIYLISICLLIFFFLWHFWCFDSPSWKLSLE